VGFDRAGQNGVICSWLGDRPAGFTDNEVMQLQRVTRQLTIALKAKIERNVAQNIAHAYLGKRAGQAVLNGLIRRGDGEKSPLRCGTAICATRQNLRTGYRPKPSYTSLAAISR